MILVADPAFRDALSDALKPSGFDITSMAYSEWESSPAVDQKIRIVFVDEAGMKENLKNAFTQEGVNNSQRLDWVGIYRDNRKQALAFIIDQPQSSLLQETGDPDLLKLEIKKILKRHNLNRELELTERRMKAHIRNQNTRRKELESFSHIIAHDLRSPLASIQGFSDALMEMDASEDQKNFLQIISNNTRRSIDLIDAMYGLSGLSAQDFLMKETDLQELLEGVLESLHSRIKEAGAEIEISCPHVIRCEASLLLQAVENLVSNAIKFAGSPPSLLIESCLEGDEIFLAVEDNGPGIPEEKRDLIFHSFSRTEEAMGKEGLGLGLSTVRKIVDIHQGEIRVDSGRKLEGARFMMKLPAMPLYVDIIGVDERESHFLEVLLQEKGHRVRQRSLSEGPDENSDVILIDWKGDESRDLWSAAELWDSPLLALGPHDQRVMEEALKAGASEYLSKPFSPASVLERIDLAREDLF